MIPMTHKGYAARIEYSDEDGCFVGRVAGIRDIIGFHGSSVDELRAAFREAVDFYLESCAERGETPDKPFSGRFNVRVPPPLHRAAALAAAREGVSLNVFVERAIEQAAGDVQP